LALLLESINASNRGAPLREYEHAFLNNHSKSRHQLSAVHVDTPGDARRSLLSVAEFANER